MSKKPRSRCILKLTGIKAADILARYIVDEQSSKININEFVSTQIISKPVNIKEITTMRMLLENGKEYPEFTNARCWWDHNTFETSPIGIPIKYYYKNDIHHFECNGYFCSFNCLKSYLKDHKSNPLYTNVLTNFKLVHYLVYGEGNNEIKEANDWQLLDCYNDNTGLSIDEFRKTLVAYKPSYNIKLVPCGEYYETTPRNLSKIP